MRPPYAVSPLLLSASLACYEGAGAESRGTDSASASGEVSGDPTPPPSTSTSGAPTGTGESSSGATSNATSAGEPDGPLCDAAPPPDGRALALDGASRARIEAAPHLGLSTFTLKAWVRRDARGRTAGTGAGGLKLVPIVAKGRGESDGGVADVNYAFGLFGDVLGADFEDMESGANHPVIGRTAISLGEWHHVAATFDGAALRLYLDGELDGEAAVTATPRFDSIQPLGLGAAFNTEGTPAGGLVGALDEVRLYDRALDLAELRATMASATPTAAGLVAHYHLDELDPVRDALGVADGVGEGSLAIGAGAVLDRGAAPRLRQPRAAAKGADRWVLAVDVDDADGEPIAVDFYARALGEADDFTIVALPDTQYYTRDADPPARPQPDDPEYFYAQTRWAWEHRHARRVVGLVTLGDNVNNADQPAQWARADAALGILEDTSDPAFPHGLPYSIAFGNHDQYPRDEAGATQAANAHFGVDRFADRAYYGGNFDGDNDESVVYFQAGGLTIVVIALQFDLTPDPEVLAWARQVFEAHPRALGIVTSHSIVTGKGELSGQGEAIHAALAGAPNVQIMASGHVAQAARRIDTYAGGHVVHSMLSDFQRSAPDPLDPERPVVVEQSQTNGGLGYMRIWGFAPARQELYVETYSPARDAAYTDEDNEFALRVPLVGAGRGPFAPIGTAIAEAGVAMIDGPRVAAGEVVEWYAVARDCAHAVATPIQQIDRTAP